MTLQEFTGYATARGMLVANQMAFGEVKGYPFTITAKGNPVQSMTVSFKLAYRLPKKVYKSAKRALQGSAKLFYFNNDPLLVGLTCAGRDEGLWNRIFAAMDIVAQEFLEAGVAIPQQCPLCKNAGCDSLAYIGDGYVPVHKSCCESQSYGALAEAEANQNAGHYWSGIIGAILGGTIATIPTILLMYFAELISAWLYALIPLGAYFGYRLLKGKMGRAVLPVVILVAIAELFFVQQVMWYLALHDAYGVWPYISDSLRYFSTYVTTEDMIMDLIQPAIFTALGIFISYGQIRRNNHTEVRNAGLILNSLFVKNGAPVQPSPVQSTPVQAPEAENQPPMED
ncbi:MAG: hypothetical protein HFE64_05570 [Lachnospiraceae bacterium]|jgi:hypothetical protein|nr:hypothetical protein [Lachnospiraceae bacterium]